MEHPQLLKVYRKLLSNREETGRFDTKRKRDCAEMSLKWLLASVLLLLLCSEVLSNTVKKRGAVEKNVLTQIKDTAQGYINYVSDVTNSWVEKVRSMDISQRVWSNYNSFVSTVDTYKNILTDQVVYFWQD